MNSILVVDDLQESRESIKSVFSTLFHVYTAPDTDAALKILESRQISVMLLDIMMPGKDGLTFLKEARELYPALPVIMISGSTRTEHVLESLNQGAVHFLSKPFDAKQLREVVRSVMQKSARTRQLQAIEQEARHEFPVNSVVGESPVFTKTIHDLRNSAQTHEPVLIQGCRGTGKELLARFMHSQSPQQNEPFITISSTHVPLLGLEEHIFGKESLTTGIQPGALDLSSEGVLFLHQVNEFPNPLQTKLAHVINNKRFTRVSGSKEIPTSVRFIASLTLPLNQAVSKGGLTPELAAEIRHNVITVPNLSERKEDIPQLVHYFLSHFVRNHGIEAKDIEPGTMELLRKYEWPGNVLELRNVVERLLVSVLNSDSRTITPNLLPDEFHATPSVKKGQVKFEEAVRSFERELIVQALTDSNGVQARAAELLGTTRRILNYRIKQLGIRTTAE